MAFFNRQRFALLCAVAVGLAGCGGDDDSYETVTVGGKKWMKRNLNINADSSWCYENNEDSCAKYGRLYTWAAAKSACSLAGSGWRLPIRADWDSLKVAVGGSSVAGKILKTKNGWYDNGNGTDEFDFSALPGGYRNSDGNFYIAGYYGSWWTATESDTNKAYYRDIYYDVEYLREDNYIKNHGFSVRCVKD